MIAVPEVEQESKPAEDDFLSALSDAVDSEKDAEAVSAVETAIESGKPRKPTTLKSGERIAKKKPDMESAERVVERLKKSLKPVPTAYKPSGGVASETWIWSPLGVVAGTPVFAVCAAINIAIVYGIIFLGLKWMEYEVDGDFSDGFARSGVQGVVLAIFGAIAGGAGSASLMEWFRVKGRNRNSALAVSFAIIGAIAGFALVALLGRILIARSFTAVGFLIAGILSAAATAGLVTYFSQGEKKFCERCGLWM